MKIQIKQSELTRSNPVARAMSEGGGQFRPRVVRDRTKYNRKTKHRKGDLG
jgi:hypothetical protein